jgi:hypothetical protein
MITDQKQNGQFAVITGASRGNNVSSMAALSPLGYKTVYPASKAYVHSFSRGLNQELKDSNVFVSVVNPGAMKTRKEITDRIERQGFLGKQTLSDPGKVAKLLCTNMKSVLFIMLLLSTCYGYSQSDTVYLKKKNYPGISANYQFGHVLPTTDFVRGDNLSGKPIEKYRAYSMKMVWQNPGYTNWQKVYRAPYYGVGLTLGDFNNPKEVGYPVSVYGILGLPVKRWNRLELYSEFQFGIASSWKHYDSIRNPKNLAVGGVLTVHLNVGISAFYPITKKLDLGAGVSFVHFSNGGFERPNYGFNIYSPSVELKYHLYGRPDTRSVKSPGRLSRSNGLYLMLGYGDYQLSSRPLDTTYFAVGGISAILYTQFSNAFRLGYGTDLNYWMGLNARSDGTPGPRTAENFTVGFLLQPEFLIDRLTLVGGIGIYAIHRNYGNFRQTYQRLGVRYEVYRNLSLGVNIRSINFILAEFLEFNLGYRIRWDK